MGITRYQPQGLLKVNQRHSMARHLAMLLSSGSAVDIVSGTLPSKNAAIAGACQVGAGLKCTGTGQQVTFNQYVPLVTSNPNGTGDYTIAVWLDTPVESVARCVFRQADDRLNVPYTQVGLFTNTNDFNPDPASLSICAYHSQGHGIRALNALDGNPHFFVLTRRSGSLYVYRDGVRLTNVQTYGNTALPVWRQGISTGIGAGPQDPDGNSGSYNRIIPFLATFNIGVDDAQAAELSRNYWQLLALDAQEGSEEYLSRSFNYIDTTGSSSGAATANSVIVGVASTNATSLGSAVSQAFAVSVSNARGAASGTATLTGTAACVWQVSGQAYGNATVAAVASYEENGGRVVIDAAGASYGSSTATATGQALISAIGSALAMSFSWANGAAVITATGQAAGSSTVNSVCVSIHNSVASSLSVSEVNAVTQSVVATLGRSTGTATVSGKTEGGVHYTATGDKFSISISFSQYSMTVETDKYNISFN